MTPQLATKILNALHRAIDRLNSILPDDPPSAPQEAAGAAPSQASPPLASNAGSWADPELAAWMEDGTACASIGPEMPKWRATKS